jgi:hypothetical protein
MAWTLPVTPEALVTLLREAPRTLRGKWGNQPVDSTGLCRYRPRLGGRARRASGGRPRENAPQKVLDFTGFTAGI